MLWDRRSADVLSLVLFGLWCLMRYSYSRETFEYRRRLKQRFEQPD